MANQNDFEKLVVDMQNTETVNEAINTLLTGLSTMLENDAKAAKTAPPFIDKQLEAFNDTAVNLTAHSSEILDELLSFIQLPTLQIDKSTETYISIAERLAAQPPRSPAHAAVQGVRGVSNE